MYLILHTKPEGSYLRFVPIGYRVDGDLEVWDRPTELIAELEIYIDGRPYETLRIRIGEEAVFEAEGYLYIEEGGEEEKEDWIVRYYDLHIGEQKYRFPALVLENKNTGEKIVGVGDYDSDDELEKKAFSIADLS